MTINQFIEKAIEGGWSYEGNADFQGIIGGCAMFSTEAKGHPIPVMPQEVLLDPEAWKAVGKVEEWNDLQAMQEAGDWQMTAWRMNMHRMIDALADGKSIEEFLATL